MDQDEARRRAIRHLMNFRLPLVSPEVTRFCVYLFRFKNSRIVPHGSAEVSAIEDALRKRIERYHRRFETVAWVKNYQDEPLVESKPRSPLRETHLDEIRRFREQGASINDLIDYWNVPLQNSDTESQGGTDNDPPILFADDEREEVADFVFSPDGDSDRIDELAKKIIHQQPSDWADRISELRDEAFRLSEDSKEFRELWSILEAEGGQISVKSLSDGNTRWHHRRINRVVEASNGLLVIRSKGIPGKSGRPQHIVKISYLRIFRD